MPDPRSGAGDPARPNNPCGVGHGRMRPGSVRRAAARPPCAAPAPCAPVASSEYPCARARARQATSAAWRPGTGPRQTAGSGSARDSPAERRNPRETPPFPLLAPTRCRPGPRSALPPHPSPVTPESRRACLLPPLPPCGSSDPAKPFRLGRVFGPGHAFGPGLRARPSPAQA